MLFCQEERKGTRLYEESWIPIEQANGKKSVAIKILDLILNLFSIKNNILFAFLSKSWKNCIDRKTENQCYEKKYIIYYDETVKS